MYAHLCKGVRYNSVHEILLPYAGIIRIRFMGMISARTIPDTPANIILSYGTKVMKIISLSTLLAKLHQKKNDLLS